MPLSADLLLCAWCPSLLAEIREGLESAKHDCRAEGLCKVMRGELNAAGMKEILDEFSSRTQPLEELVTRATEGRPVSSIPANMDYYNSLQMSWAYRYVISRDGDFELARHVNRANPDLRRGRRMKMA